MRSQGAAAPLAEEVAADGAGEAAVAAAVDCPVVTPAPTPLTPPPSIISTPAPTPRRPLAFSTKTCAELGWTNAALGASPSVCGESDDGLGGCSAALTFAEAMDFCEGPGARLCSHGELNPGDETTSTGCSESTMGKVHGPMPLVA